MKRNAQHPEVASPELHQDLIKGCLRGDQKAQLGIYKLYYRTVYNISLSIVKNASEAEEIMQESFLAAFENIHGFSGTAGLIDWLECTVKKRSNDSMKEKNFQAHFETF